MTTRKVRYVTPVCDALDINGKRCKCTRDLKRHQYHGDGELYFSFESEHPKFPSWVAVWLCPKHRGDL